MSVSAEAGSTSSDVSSIYQPRAGRTSLLTGSPISVMPRPRRSRSAASGRGGRRLDGQPAFPCRETACTRDDCGLRPAPRDGRPTSASPVGSGFSAAASGLPVGHGSMAWSAFTASAVRPGMRWAQWSSQVRGGALPSRAATSWIGRPAVIRSAANVWRSEQMLSPSRASPARFRIRVKRPPLPIKREMGLRESRLCAGMMLRCGRLCNRLRGMP